MKKRILSIALCLIMIFSTVLPVISAESNTDGYVTLPELETQMTEIRTRKKVDGLRMYVDEENPLFIIRNCPIWGGPQTGKAFAEYAIKTYYALPEDVMTYPGRVLSSGIKTTVLSGEE